jgi:hypothetical protein
MPTNRTVSRRDSVNQSLLNMSDKQSEKHLEKQLKLSEKDPTKTKSSRGDHDNKPCPTSQVCESQTIDKTVIAPSSEFNSFKEEIKEFFLKYDEKLDRRLNEFDDKFTSIFRDLKKEMSEMRLEVYESKKELKELISKVNTMEESVEFQAKLIEDKAEANDDKMEKYIQELEDLKTKMTMQEKHDRRYNLLFYGFPEEKNENIKTVMKTFFTEKLEIPKEDVDSMIFANYHRIPNDGKGPKPIIVKFLCMPDRDLVYSKFLHPVLREERKRILSDLPVKMKQERGRIAKLAYEIRQSEKLQTRIVEQGMSLFLEVRDSKTQPWKRRDTTN